MRPQSNTTSALCKKLFNKKENEIFLLIFPEKYDSTGKYIQLPKKPCMSKDLIKKENERCFERNCTGEK